MKKIANFIGLGVLGCLGLGLVFNAIALLIGLGDVIDAFKADGGFGFVTLLIWIISIAVAALLILFIVFQLIKAIPNIKNIENDEKSLFRMNIISGLLSANMVANLLIIMIYYAAHGGDLGGQAIVRLIFLFIALGAALVSFLGKGLPKLVRVILTLVATLLVFVFFIMSISDGATGLTMVYYVFAMLAVFGGLGYVVLENLDAFKGQK